MTRTLQGIAPVLPGCAITSFSCKISHKTSSHVIDDYIHIDIHAMLPALLDHGSEFQFIPRSACQPVRHWLVPGPPAAMGVAALKPVTNVAGHQVNYGHSTLSIAVQSIAPFSCPQKFRIFSDLLIPRQHGPGRAKGSMGTVRRGGKTHQGSCLTWESG